MSLDTHPLLDVFYDEAAEHLIDLEAVLRSVDAHAPDPGELELMFRAACSAKASSITLGLADVTELAHQLERLLDRLRREQLVVTSEFRDAGLQASAVLRALLAAHRGTGSVETACAERARRRLQVLAGRRGTGAAGPRAPALSEAASAAVLPVGWRSQARRGPAPPSDASRPTGSLLESETTVARESTTRRQDRPERAGTRARNKL